MSTRALRSAHMDCPCCGEPLNCLHCESWVPDPPDCDNWRDLSENLAENEAALRMMNDDQRVPDRSEQ